MNKMLIGLVEFQRKLCRLFDCLLPSMYRIDGNADYLRFVWRYIRPSYVVWDVGGGKKPLVSMSQKIALRLRVVGVDINSDQLSQAPVGLYDDTVTADIQRFQGLACADVVVCQALLEHVNNIEFAFKGLNTILRPGGTALLFVPSRRALFARLNRLLPEGLKKRILFSLFPSVASVGGFPAFYDRCTPREIRDIAARCGFELIEQRVYFMSSYFSCFVPAYIGWRCWLLVYKVLAGDEAAETMSFAFAKTRSAESDFIFSRRRVERVAERALELSAPDK